MWKNLTIGSIQRKKAVKGDFRIGEWLVQPQLNRVVRFDTEVTLEPKVMEVLVYLAGHSGEVLRKERIIQAVWEDTFVTDDVLVRAIATLRRVFNDDPKQPRVIQTVAKRGYCLMAAISGQEGGREVGKRVLVRWVVGTILVTVLISAGLVWLLHRPTRGPEVQLIPSPLTSYVGREGCPTFSPDGSQIAFYWDGESQDNLDIYVQQVNGEGRLRLTKDPARDISPVWSPDGRFIAFVRVQGFRTTELFLIPPLGGEERQIGGGEFATSTDSPANELLRESSAAPHLSWSPDGRWLAVSQSIIGEESSGLCLVSVETGEARELTSPSQGLDGYPAFSPDGRKLAFSRYMAYGAQHLYWLAFSQDLIPVGEPIQLTEGPTTSFDPVWSRDSSEIIYAAGVGGQGNTALYRISTNTLQEPRRLTVGTEYARSPVVSKHGHRLAYVRASPNANIYRAPLPQAGTAQPPRGGQPEPFIYSTHDDTAAQYSPDGSRVLFRSFRSGHAEIWVCDNKGQSPRMLTSFQGPTVAAPVWSPDSTKISFHCVAQGTQDIYVVSSAGGASRRLTREEFTEATSAWSRDGKWIYFRSNRSGDRIMRIWKIPAEGGVTERVTVGEGFCALESPDGKTLYFSRPGSLWSLSLEEGKEEQVIESLAGNNLFTVVDEGIYYIPEERDDIEGFWICFLDFSIGTMIPFVPVTKDLDRIQNSRLSVSPDGRSILFSLKEDTSDLMLVENFR